MQYKKLSLRYAITLIAILHSTFSGGQCLFEKAFASLGDDDFYDMEVLGDSGIIACGATSLNDTLSFQSTYVIRLDSCGNVMWQKEYGVQSDGDGAVSVIPAVDGGYIVLGGAAFFHSPVSARVLKLNAKGDTLWTKVYVDLIYASDIIATSDSSYIFIGSRSDFVGSKTYAYACKISKVGSIIWEKRFDLSLDGDGSGSFFKKIYYNKSNIYTVFGVAAYSGNQISMFNLSEKGDSIECKYLFKSEPFKGGLICAAQPSDKNSFILGINSTKHKVAYIDNTGAIIKYLYLDQVGYDPDSFALWNYDFNASTICYSSEGGFLLQKGYRIFHVDTQFRILKYIDVSGLLSNIYQSNNKIIWGIGNGSGKPDNPKNGNDFYMLKTDFEKRKLSTQNLKSSNINIYPNPTFDFFTIEVPVQLVNSGYVVRDMLGTVICTGVLNTEKTIVNVKGFKPGVYFIHSSCSETHWKLLIE